MGSGGWSSQEFTSYCRSNRGVAQGNFSQSSLHRRLNPLNVVRECVDSEEHPNTLPVILALDVTGSMGPAAKEVARKMNEIMTDLYAKVKDVEFLVMGIGDLATDSAPIQASQFESDIRISEAIDKIYFENGGGSNTYESYSAAWYFGLHNTKLDCFDKRGQKGIIITIGDELMNPFLPKEKLNLVLGSEEQSNVDTAALYAEASKKFDIYHIQCFHRQHRYFDDGLIPASWKLLGDNFKNCTIENFTKAISDIIINRSQAAPVMTEMCGMPTISW